MAELEDRVEQIESDLMELKADIKELLIELKELALREQNPLADQNPGQSRSNRDQPVIVVTPIGG